MKLRIDKRMVNGKEYLSYRATLTKREHYLLNKLGKEFEIKDVDPKGFVELKLVDHSTTTSADVIDPVHSFRSHLSDDEWNQFKMECRSRGVNVCWAIDGFVKACNQMPDLVEEPGGVKNVYVFYGKPRSKFRELAWQKEGVKGK